MPPVILILEASPELRGMLEDGLGQGGYVVRTVSNAEEALGIMRRTKVNLVVADPPTTDGKSGVRMLDEIHEAFPEVPSIVVSSEVFDPDGFLSGIEAHPRRQLLRRPFTLGALLSAVRRAVGAARPDAAPH